MSHNSSRFVALCSPPDGCLSLRAEACHEAGGLLGLSWSELQMLRIILLPVEVWNVALPRIGYGCCSAMENGSCVLSWKMRIIGGTAVSLQAQISPFL